MGFEPLLLLLMLEANVPLHTWRVFREGLPSANRQGVGYGTGHSRLASPRVQASRVVAALAHANVVELVALEWERLPPGLRTEISDLCNQECQQPRSNNAVKGITALNARLMGKLLAVSDERPTERRLRVVDGKQVAVSVRLSPAAVGAQAAFMAFPKPEGYDSMSPKEKRAWSQEAAAARRASKY